MSLKIVMDSCCNVHEIPGMDFASVPLIVQAGEREFVDDKHLKLDEMVGFLQEHKGRCTTACPSVGAYLDAFGDAENVMCLTISSQLSGSYNAAVIAAQTYQQQHPGHRVHVFDTRSCGAALVLMAEKIRELREHPFDEIVSAVQAYQQKLALIFSLESLRNLANNGRVPHTVAAVTNILGIRMIGKASDEGKIQPIGKARGERRLIPELVRHIRDLGYSGGKLIIHHCCNPGAAASLETALREHFPNASMRVGSVGGLCGFYAEKGGMIIGFEI